MILGHITDRVIICNLRPFYILCYRLNKITLVFTDEKRAQTLALVSGSPTQADTIRAKIHDTVCATLTPK